MIFYPGEMLFKAMVLFGIFTLSGVNEIAALWFGILFGFGIEYVDSYGEYVQYKNLKEETP